jgi:hypothetical protein
VQQNLEQADDARVVDFDAWVADRADGNREGNLLQQRKVGVDVEPLGLEPANRLMMPWNLWRTWSR